MSSRESWRSSADSTSVVKAGESWSPQGLCLPEGPAVPVGEVDEAALLGQLALGVVDPVAREGAGPDQVSVRPSRRRGSRGRAWSRPGGRRTGRTAPAGPGGGRAPRSARRRSARRSTSSAVTPALVAGRAGRPPGKRPASARAARWSSRSSLPGLAAVDDAAFLHLDPGLQLVGETEPVGVAQTPRGPRRHREAAGRSGRCPLSKGTLVAPAIASEGIHEIDVTAASIRIGVTLRVAAGVPKG